MTSSPNNPQITTSSDGQIVEIIDDIFTRVFSEYVDESHHQDTETTLEDFRIYCESAVTDYPYGDSNDEYNHAKAVTVHMTEDTFAVLVETYFQMMDQ
jgi:hypothetical protein